MALSVSWSPEAKEDLKTIASYIARDSVFYAKAVVGKIRDSTRQLKDFPNIGRIVPGLGDPNVRERFVYDYRVIYKIEEGNIRIIAVIHGKRLLKNID